MSVAAMDAARDWRASLFRPRYDGTLSDWARDLELPQSTRGSTFEPNESPWLKDPANDLLDPAVEQVTFVGAAGSAKSLLGEIYIGYIVKEDGGIMYYVHQDDEAAQDVMEDRIEPMFVANEQIRDILPTEKGKKRVVKIRFPTGTLYALGANKNNARSKRVKHSIWEEVHLWKKGMLTAFKKRRVAVPGSKALLLTTGTNSGDEADTVLKTGTLQEWHICCPDCKQAQIMKRENLIYEISPRTMDRDGNYKWGAIRESVYYQCEHCDPKEPTLGKWKDTPEVRRWLTDTGHFIQTNPNASGENKSYRIAAYPIHWNKWADLAVQWILANIAKRAGDNELLENYIKEVDAREWDEAPREENPKLSSAREGNYLAGVHWDEQKKCPAWLDADGKPDLFTELTRYMTVDKQESWFTIIIRAYSASGEGRLVLAAGGVPPGKPGSVTTFEDVERIREMYKVQATHTWIDCTHFTKEVQTRCVQYNWRGFWGSPQKLWSHDKNSQWHPIQIAMRNRQPYSHLSDRPVRLCFSPAQRGQANIGRDGKAQFCIYILWGSGDKDSVVKGHWHFVHNGGGAGWTHYKGVPQWYLMQTTAEVRRKKGDVWEWWHGKRENHATDCEQMNHVCAMMDDRIDLSASATITEDLLVSAE